VNSVAVAECTGIVGKIDTGLKEGLKEETKGLLRHFRMKKGILSLPAALK
jgi:hypothetical protein